MIGRRGFLGLLGALAAIRTITLRAEPPAPSHARRLDVISRKIYRSVPGEPGKLVATLDGNETTTWTDTASEAGVFSYSVVFVTKQGDELSRPLNNGLSLGLCHGDTVSIQIEPIRIERS